MPDTVLETSAAFQHLPAKPGRLRESAPGAVRPRILTLALLAALAGMAFSESVRAQTTWSGLSSAVTNAPAGGTINLASNITWDSGSTISITKTLTLQSSEPGTPRTISGNAASPFRLFSVSSPNTLTLGDLVLTNGGNSFGGGAIYVNSGATVRAVAGSTLEFHNNSGGPGGGIYIYGGTVVLEDVVFTNNTTSGYGTGIYVDNTASSSLTINGDAVFTDNVNNLILWWGYGGALDTNRVTVIRGNGTFRNNTTTGRGGSISLNNNGDFTIEGTLQVSDSRAVEDGGGVYVDEGNKFTALGDSSWIGNVATGDGGGLMNNNGTVTLGAPESPVSVVFEGNQSVYGMGLYCNDSSCRTNIHGDVSFIRNTTTASGTTGYGGALDNDGVVSITGNALFDGNVSPNHGGGSYNYIEKTPTITIGGNATYTGNSARNSGGAHYAGASSILTIQGDAVFQNNVAAYRGGALYNGSTSPLTLNVIANDQVYSGNVARSNGSAPVSGAGGFLYAAANTTTNLNVSDSRQLSIGTCVMNGTDSASGVSSAVLNKTGAGTLTLSADNSAWTGPWNVNGGTMRAGCASTFAASAAHTVASGAVLSANGFNQTVSVLTNSGTVQVGSASSAPGVTLTTSGTYTGNAGARLQLNTALGDSNSPSDRLVAQSVAGTTEVLINNIGGSGAATTGNGILVIQAGGTSSATFTMTPVIAGNYIYSLVKVGNNWYLQSTELPAITVFKTVTGATDAYNGERFGITVNCGSAGIKNMNLASGGSDVLRVPVNSTCTVSESPPSSPSGYTYSTVVSDPDPFTVTATGKTVTVTNTLEAELQAITITKTVAGDTGGYPSGSTFSISIDCGAAGGDTYELADGGTGTFNAPTGATCSVTEATPENPDGYAYGTPEISPAVFTVSADDLSVSVTNTLTALPQTITVNKELSGDTDGYDGAPFLILVDCGDDGSGQLKLAAGENGTWQAPSGASCSVSETAPADPAGYIYEAPLISPSNFTVPATDGVEISVRNSITALNQPITLQKTISGDVAGYNGTDTFTVRLVCDAAGTQEIDLARNGSATLYAPTGDNCEVTEEQLSDPQGYAYGTPAITPAGVFTVPAGGQIVNIDNTLTAQEQTITVTKVLDGDIRGYPAGSTFTITVDCGEDGSKMLSLSSGASGTFDAPTGATCTVSEATPANPPGYEYGAATVSEAAGFTVPSGGISVTVTSTLTALTQKITVNKYLSGDIGGYPPGEEFPVTISCDDQEPVTLNLPASGSATLDAPTGVNCTAAEALPTYPAGYAYETAEVSPRQFVVPADGQTVSITNSLTAREQAITIFKAITGDVYGYPAGAEFEITVQCERAGMSVLHLARGTSGTFNAPTGDTCTIVETPAADPDGFHYGSADISSSNIVVSPNGNDVVVTNSLSAEDQILTLTHLVSGNTAGYVAGATFPVTVVCTPPSGTSVTETINLTGNGMDDTITAPTGASCVVTEGTIPEGSIQDGYAWETPTISPASFVMPAGGQLVQITNGITALGQRINIQKVLGGDTDGMSPGTEFGIVVECDQAGTQTLLLAPNVSGGLSATTDEKCTVTEQTLPSPNDGYEYEEATITPSSFTVSALGNDVVVLNRLSAGEQPITVKKEVTGAVDGYISDSAFQITVTCTPQTGSSASTTVELADGGRDSTTISAPTGATCTVSETIPGEAAKPGYAWKTPVFSPNTFTVEDSGNAITVTNELVAQDQPVTVTKTLSGVTGAYDGEPFSILVDCGEDGQGTLSLRPEGSGAYSALTDSSCTVTETLPDAPDGYSYASPEISPAGVFTVQHDGQAVTVANTLRAEEQTVTVAKTMAGATSGYDDAPFSLTLTCDGTSTPFTLIGEASQSFDILTGASCQVTESEPTAPGGYSYAAPLIQPAGVFTVAPGDNRVTVTNTLNALSQPVTIVSRVTGATSGYMADTTFEVTIRCDGSWGEQMLSLVSGVGQTVQVPTGVSCTLSQATPSNPSGYAYSAPSFDPGDTFTVEDGGGTWVITNELTASLQTLLVKKTVDDASGGYGGEPFAISVNCGGVTYNAVLAGDASDNSQEVPTGTTCSISEVTPENPSGYTYDVPQIEPASFAMPTNGQTVAVTNRLVANQPITISVVIEGDVLAYTGDLFIIDVSCNGMTPMSAQIAGDETDDTTANAPLGASCTVRQTLPSPPDGYAYSAVISPEQFTMDEEGQTITVTNTLSKVATDDTRPIPAVPLLALLALLGVVGGLFLRRRGW